MTVIHSRRPDAISRVRSRLGRKTAKRRMLRAGFIGFNVALLSAVVFFVISSRSGGATMVPLSSSQASGSVAVNPLDQVSSADIAVTVSRMTALSEQTAITNQAQSDDVSVGTAPSTGTLVAKPEVVATAFKSKDDIQTYTAQAGDTISSIAAKFSVTSDSIRWSNGLSGDTVSAGTKLAIPPVGLSGIVYTVKSGDTIDSLAQKYKADKSELTAANDAEINGIHAGEQIIIPNGQQPVVTYSYGASSNVAWGISAIYGYNGYDYGYCTWYVASQISVPSNWGNASTWAYYAARTAGWSVSSHPTVGSIAQTPYAAGGEGHVGIVVGVSADGSSVNIRDMNNYGDGGGWGRVGEGWVSTGTYPNYIARS